MSHSVCRPVRRQLSVQQLVTRSGHRVPGPDATSEPSGCEPEVAGQCGAMVLIATKAQCIITCDEQNPCPEGTFCNQMGMCEGDGGEPDGGCPNGNAGVCSQRWLRLLLGEYFDIACQQPGEICMR